MRTLRSPPYPYKSRKTKSPRSHYPRLPSSPSKDKSPQRRVIVETIGFYTEIAKTYKGEDGRIIWICPVCEMQDGRMIGCDRCDYWYHWECVNIVTEPAEDVQWFCPKCSLAQSGSNRLSRNAKL